MLRRSLAASINPTLIDAPFLSLLCLAFGLNLLVGATDVKDLGGQAQDIPGRRINGQAVVTLDSLSATIADWPESSNLVPTIVELSRIRYNQNLLGRSSIRC